MSTRRGNSAIDPYSTSQDPPFNAALKFPPRTSGDAIVVNKLCYISHPNAGNHAIAEGKTGESWKAKPQKFGNLCGPGEQMVQVHRVFIPNQRLLYIEDRQPFQTADDCVVKATGSNIYIKWDTRYLHKKMG
ncbi:hypothetical protein KC19_VG098400 [Ceratodon purpureus]|uniref:Uncharacterized protein n=1 Tax=Ceratodon purpureus TaxID=3225 RepID=A0A8T0HPF1_CERPU|nr:hypothetical protein KC19_VG098400 [Ceratodon purpureus]